MRRGGVDVMCEHAPGIARGGHLRPLGLGQRHLRHVQTNQVVKESNNRIRGRERHHSEGALEQLLAHKHAQGEDLVGLCEHEGSRRHVVQEQLQHHLDEQNIMTQNMGLRF